jgi:hypothetical protein
VAYSIDSSGVLDLFRYYPPDVFPTIWMQMEAAARGGVIFAIDEVYRELKKKDDVAFEWLKGRRKIVVDIDTQIQQRERPSSQSIRDSSIRARIALPGIRSLSPSHSREDFPLSRVRRHQASLRSPTFPTFAKR